MTFEVIFDEEVIEFLNKLSKNTKERIFNKIISTKENPFHFFERLAGKNLYKLRIGYFRAIADIDAESKKVQVVLIGHRKNIYKNWK